MLDNPRIGVVGIPGRWSSETLADAVEARTGFRLVIDMGAVTLDLAEKKLLYHRRDLCALDGLIVKKISATYSPSVLDRLEMLRVAEASGVRVFSRPLSILRLIDRLSCTVTLGTAGIPMPDTRVTEDIGSAMAAVREYGSAVFKPLYSSKARGMCVIDSGLKAGEMERRIRIFQADNPIMYIQKKVALPGRDLGMVFLVGEYLGTYARVPQTEAWNTSIHSGGSYVRHTPSDETIAIAYRAQALFDMAFTTVDVAETDTGPMVFEVSAFGGFRGAIEGIGIDAPGRYVDHVLGELSGK